MRKEVLSVSTNVYSRNRRFVRKLRVKGERINAIVADIYNVAAAYDNPLADAQKIFLRQSR